MNILLIIGIIMFAVAMFGEDLEFLFIVAIMCIGFSAIDMNEIDTEPRKSNISVSAIISTKLDSETGKYCVTKTKAGAVDLHYCGNVNNEIDKSIYDKRETGGNYTEEELNKIQQYMDAGNKTVIEMEELIVSEDGRHTKVRVKAGDLPKDEPVEEPTKELKKINYGWE